MDHEEYTPHGQLKGLIRTLKGAKKIETCLANIPIIRSFPIRESPTYPGIHLSSILLCLCTAANKKRTYLLLHIKQSTRMIKIINKPTPMRIPINNQSILSPESAAVGVTFTVVDSTDGFV